MFRWLIWKHEIRLLNDFPELFSFGRRRRRGMATKKRIFSLDEYSILRNEARRSTKQTINLHHWIASCLSASTSLMVEKKNFWWMFFGQTIRNEFFPFFPISSHFVSWNEEGMLGRDREGQLPFPISRANTVIGKQWRRTQKGSEFAAISKCCRSQLTVVPWRIFFCRAWSLSKPQMVGVIFRFHSPSTSNWSEITKLRQIALIARRSGFKLVSLCALPVKYYYALARVHSHLRIWLVHLISWYMLMPPELLQLLKAFAFLSLPSPASSLSPMNALLCVRGGREGGRREK